MAVVLAPEFAVVVVVVGLVLLVQMVQQSWVVREVLVQHRLLVERPSLTLVAVVGRLGGETEQMPVLAVPVAVGREALQLLAQMRVVLRGP